MDYSHLKIYSGENSSRLKYITEIILGDILGLSWEIVTDKRKLGKHPVINYSSDNIAGSFKIHPVSLLFEKEIKQKNIAVSIWNNMPVFFQTKSDSDLPFDIFASSFYLVTRYEEYLQFEPDEFGRFCAYSSLAYKNGFLDKPVIDIWARELAKALLKKYPLMVFRQNEYSSMLTIDSDQSFAYLGKGIIRSIGGLLYDRSSIPLNFTDRYRIMAKGEKDPYDVYDYITGIIDKNETDSRFFFPVGDYSKYDKNPSWRNEVYIDLLKKISDKYITGLHPSFYAGNDGTLVIDELSRLKSVLQNEVSLSRYHYLRMFMPGSYEKLIDAGISEDYSMGFPDSTGFRAGIARPYLFYNLKEDRITGLKIFPFQVMDGTLYDYMKLDTDKSKEVIMNLISETKKVGGLFISIWHNTSLLDNEERRPWRDVFEFMINNQKQ